MQQKIFRHNRSTSPTVREATTGIRAPGAASQVTGPSARAQPQGLLATLRGIVEGRRQPPPVTFQSPSYKTISWPVDPLDHAPLQPAHTRLDCGHIDSTEMPFLLCDRLEANWRGRPILFCYERTAAAMGHDVAGKNRRDGALQVLVNCKSESLRLKQAFSDFAGNARALLTGRTAEGERLPAGPAVPLAKILDAIWPTMEFRSEEEKQAWTRRTLQSPEAFVAQSYDALSLALGRVAIVIPQAKADMYATGRLANANYRQVNFNTMVEAQNAYVDARDAFEAPQLPLTPSVLNGHSVLSHYSIPQHYWPA